MKFNRLVRISTASHIYRTYLTKVPVINGAYFQKNSQKPLLQAHTIHKFASKFEYSSDDDDHFSFKYLEPGVDFHSITNGNKTLEKKLKIILYEIYNYRSECLPIPDKLENKHYKMLLNIPTESIRKRYLKEVKKFNDHYQSDEKKQCEFSQKNIPNHIWYGYDHNTMLQKINYKQIEEIVLNPLACKSLHNNNIIIDFSFEDHMELKELSRCIRELYTLFFFNSVAPSSFNIHLCNVKKEGKLSKMFYSLYNKKFDDIVNVHEKNYLDIFPNEKLVYLTPHASNELVSYDCDHIYIIGGFMDKFPFNHPLTYNKATSENITVRRFPLDEILNWKRGSKTFGICTSFKIISDFSYYRNWDLAFRNLNIKFIEHESLVNGVTQYRNLLTALEKHDKNENLYDSFCKK